MFDIHFKYCKYLSEIGVSSGSAFVIHLSTFEILLLTIIVHLLFIIPYLLTRNPTKVKMFHKIMKAIFNYLTFGVYIRLFLEIFFRYCLVAAMEIYDGNDKSSDVARIMYPHFPPVRGYINLKKLTKFFKKVHPLPLKQQQLII